MTTLYTVYRSDESSTAVQRLPLQQAAHILLVTDGYAYEVREEKGGLKTLFISDGSANSTRSARHLNPTRIMGWSVEEIWKQVVATDWRGYEAMPDKAFDAMIQRLKEENKED